MGSESLDLQRSQDFPFHYGGALKTVKIDMPGVPPQKLGGDLSRFVGKALQ